MTRTEINNLTEELEPDYDVFSEDSQEMTRYKSILQNLPADDKTIFIMYIELGSLRKVAAQLGVSHTLLYKHINRIKKEFL